MDNTQIFTSKTSGYRHAVILLHGLARTRRSFVPLARRLRASGYIVANIGYPSLSGSIAMHAAQVKAVMADLAGQNVSEVSFVAHSLGGLVVRRALAGSLPLPVGRIVLLGPPNRGSYLAAWLSRFRLYHYVFGSCGREVLAQYASNLPMPDAPVAIIAGGNGRRGYNPFLPGDNDGVVTVGETTLDGRESFLRVPCLHTFLPFDGTVMKAVQHFLETGQINQASKSDKAVSL